MTDPLARRIVLLTINADGHDLMRQFHNPVDEKRMVVTSPPDSYDQRLKATPLQTMEYLRQYPPEWMLAGAELLAQRSLLA